MGKPARKNRADRGHKVQNDTACGIASGRLDIVAHLLDLPHEALGPIEKHAAGDCRQHAASVSDKELHPQLLLEKLDLSAKSGLGGPKAIRRLAQASKLGDGSEGAQLLNVHASPGSPHASSCTSHQEGGAVRIST